MSNNDENTKQCHPIKLLCRASFSILHAGLGRRQCLPGSLSYQKTLTSMVRTHSPMYCLTLQFSRNKMCDPALAWLVPSQGACTEGLLHSLHHFLHLFAVAQVHRKKWNLVVPGLDSLRMWQKDNAGLPLWSTLMNSLLGT